MNEAPGPEPRPKTPPVTVPAATVAFRGAEGSTELDARIGGEWIEGVRLHRCFPLSDPARYVSVLDKEGDERAVLDDLGGLDESSRRLADRELDRRYFTPDIERITLLKPEAGMWHFVVETGRGVSDFYVRNWRDSAFELKPGRWQITSVDGGRYEIPNLERLDPASLRLLDQLL